MKTLNKTISLSLVTALTLQSSLSAAGIMENALQNYTPASTYKAKDSSGNAVKSMYYSGGYYFRFNNANTAQPLWAFSPPEIEAGCNGFNLKGMFVSLLGLDQFGAMLQNAGTTLAWGVAVGLIYSLPGISAVFKQLNAWAKDIQKLLSMGCQAGIAIGQAIGNNIPGYDKKAIDDAITNALPADGLSKHLQSGIKGTIDALDLKGLDFNWESGFSFSGGDSLSAEDKKDAISAPLQKMFGNHSLGGSIINDYLKLPGAQVFKTDIVQKISKDNENIFNYKRLFLTYNKDIDFTSTNDFALVSSERLANNITSVEGKSNIGLRFLSYAIFYNMVGDLGYSKELIDTTLKRYNDMFKCSNANSTAQCTAGETREEADKSLIKELENPNSKSGEISFVGHIGTPDVNNLINFILKGEFIDATTASQNKIFMAPTFMIMSGKEPKSALKNYFITTTDNPESKPYFNSGDNFPGTITLAKCSVYNSLKTIGIDNNTLTELQKNHKNEILNCDNYDNMISSDIAILADILSKATDTEKSDGINLLTNYHVFLITSAVLKNLSAMTYSQQMNDIKKLATGGTAEETSTNQSFFVPESKQLLLKKIENFQKALEQAQVQLENDYPDAKNGIYGDISLSTYFNNLRKSIQERQAPKQ